MSDLHDRITAALFREDQLRVCKLSDADIKFMADAVIAALGADYILVPKSYAIATAKTERRDCNPHPDAPHGFDRSGSHAEDRYVCDCENWVPPDPWESRADEARQEWAYTTEWKSSNG